jgi:hypothetical protein
MTCCYYYIISIATLIATSENFIIVTINYQCYSYHYYYYYCYCYYLTSISIVIIIIYYTIYLLLMDIFAGSHGFPRLQRSFSPSPAETQWTIPEMSSETSLVFGRFLEDVTILGE